MGKKDRPGPSFYEAVVAPRLNQERKAVKDEMEYRLQQARAVMMTVEREAVNTLHGEIEADLQKVAQGGNPTPVYKKLVDVVAVKDGPVPFLSRMEAIKAIGILARNGKIVLDYTQKLGQTLLHATASDPFPRGGPILLGVLLGTLGKEAGAAVGEPDTNNEQEMNKWRRQLMIAEVATRFSDPGGFDFSMILPEWWRIQGGFRLAGTSKDDDEFMRPKFVARLRELVRGTGDRGMHICSEDMQLLAAAMGMPRNDQYEAGDLLKRNPSLVRGFPRLALDEKVRSRKPQIKVQGVLIEPLTVLDDDRREELEEMMASLKGGLPYRAARKELTIDALSYIVAARAKRRVGNLDPRAQRGRISAAIETEIKRTMRAAEVQHREDGQIVSTEEVSILSSYLDQYRKERKRPRVTLEQAALSVKTVAQGLLCTIDDLGDPVVRPEGDILRLVNELITRRISPEDARRFPGLVERDLFDTETVVRRKAPEGVRPPISIETPPKAIGK